VGIGLIQPWHLALIGLMTLVIGAVVACFIASVGVSLRTMGGATPADGWWLGADR
jgi:hypothetical protein